jgi:hypothetical protein
MCFICELQGQTRSFLDVESIVTVGGWIVMFANVTELAEVCAGVSELDEVLDVSRLLN